jgi:hypothetical protein
MRWLFLLLLFLNLAYIAWEMNRPATDAYSHIKTTRSNVQPIVLLSEISQQQQGEVPQNQPDEEPIDNKPVAAEKAKKDLPRLEQPGSRVAEIALPPEKGIPPAQNLEADDGCYTLGPFRDLEDLRELTRELKPYVVAVDFRGSEAKEQSLYWVYIKPANNREEAIATGEQLKANKIKDYFIIRQGENLNGVSLGYFRNKAGADALEKRVKQLGFDVVLETVFKTYTVYWLDYQVGADRKVPQSIFDKYIIEASKKDRIKRLKRDCTL